MAKINVQQTDVTILQINDTDYISLTDMNNWDLKWSNLTILNPSNSRV